MDSNSLGRIENALNNMVRAIASRLQQASRPLWHYLSSCKANVPVQLDDAVEASSVAAERASANALSGADREIDRTKKLIAKIDALEEEMEEVKNVCKKIKALKQKCDQAGGRMDQIALARAGRQPPTSSRR